MKIKGFVGLLKIEVQSPEVPLTLMAEGLVNPTTLVVEAPEALELTKIEYPLVLTMIVIVEGSEAQKFLRVAGLVILMIVGGLDVQRVLTVGAHLILVIVVGPEIRRLRTVEPPVILMIVVALVV